MLPDLVCWTAPLPTAQEVLAAIAEYTTCTDVRCYTDDELLPPIVTSPERWAAPLLLVVGAAAGLLFATTRADK